MAKLNYGRDVKTLVNQIQAGFQEATGSSVHVKSHGEKWLVTQESKQNSTVLYEGTLRECYCFLIGMQKFL